MNFLLEDSSSDKNYYIYNVPDGIADGFRKLMELRIIGEDIDLMNLSANARALQIVVFQSMSRWEKEATPIPILSIDSLEDLHLGI